MLLLSLSSSLHAQLDVVAGDHNGPDGSIRHGQLDVFVDDYDDPDEDI